MDLIAATTTFSALSQTTRLDVLRLLIKAGPEGRLAGEIGEALGVKQNTMSANLAILHKAGLLRSERQGRSIRYFADFNALGQLLQFLMEDCCGGQPDLCDPLIKELTCSKD